MLQPPRLLLIFVLGLLLTGCGAAPSLYMLPDPARNETGAVATRFKSMVVEEISLPDYAAAHEIAVKQPTGILKVDETQIWADTPRRALSRHLINALSGRLESRISADPWPGFEQPDLRVEVVVDDMVGAPGGILEFNGQYILVQPRSGDIFASERFAFTVAVADNGYPGLITAHARAIELLADAIATRITGKRSRPTLSFTTMPMARP